MLVPKLERLAGLRTQLKALREEVDYLELEIAEEWPWSDEGPTLIEVPGLGLAVRHRKTNRTQWDTDELRRAVLDTVIATDDGEIIEESTRCFPSGTSARPD
jgi:hypothetical protein